MEKKFFEGDYVQVKSTGKIGKIESIDDPVYFVRIFKNDKCEEKDLSKEEYMYEEKDLISYLDNEEVILKKLKASIYSNAESFQKYAYYKLFSESQEGNLFSYQGNKIEFNPFQYKPLIKFLSIQSDERLLIADEVGVGKTIESGIIIDELISRGDLKNNDAIMIVCPHVLCRKWRYELKNKFLLDDFFIHTGETLSEMFNVIKKEKGKIQFSHSIVSEQLIRSEKYQLLLKECLEERGEPFLKLLILDECHHYRNPETSTHKIGLLLSLCSERVIMLSATPFNLQKDDLYYQLHILNPTLFSDKNIFYQLSKQIECINKSILLLKSDNVESREKLNDVLEEVKNLANKNEYIKKKFLVLYEKIKKGELLSVKEKVDFEKIVSDLNPIANSFTRTLKRDAIPPVIRETMTIEVNYSSEEKDIYDSFLKISIERCKMFGINPIAFGLILNSLERIATSSLKALGKNIEKFKNMLDVSDEELLDEEFIERMSENIKLDNIKIENTMLTMLRENYSELLDKISRIDNDCKYNTFKQLVIKIQDALGDNKKIIVFAFYTETLKYLRRKLRADGYHVALMYGKTPDKTLDKKDEDGFEILSRNEIVQNFKEGKYDILLVSEVGSEGLDFQFCSALINYDLPYNPMRIEQRIGRIDRIGQKAEKIIIGNICIKDTIDEVINKVLLSRIAEAVDLIGELEPIIAEEWIQIAEKLITKKLSEDDVEEIIKKIGQSEEKKGQMIEELDKGINDKEFTKKFEDRIKKSRITPHESLLFTEAFLKKENNCSCEIIPNSDSAAKISVSKDICEKFNTYLDEMGIEKVENELNKIIENNGELEIDFDGNSAYTHANRVFFKRAGIWIHFVINYIKDCESEKKENVFYVSIPNTEISRFQKGRYWLFIYEMNFEGFFTTKIYEYLLSREDNSKVICLSEDEKKTIFQKIRVSEIPQNIDLDSFDKVRMKVEEFAIQRTEEIATEAMEKNTIKISSRIYAIEKLSDIRIEQLEEKFKNDKEKLQKLINKEKEKVNKKRTILERKLKYNVKRSLDAICLLDVIGEV